MQTCGARSVRTAGRCGRIRRIVRSHAPSVEGETMMEQLEFGTSTKTIQEKFEEFHAANPWVYAELVKLARRARDRGARKVGMKMLVEIVRWRRYMATQDFNSGFKVNNIYTSRYVRLIEDQEPDLRGLFETRELKAP
jgi:hypothetical protein